MKGMTNDVQNPWLVIATAERQALLDRSSDINSELDSLETKRNFKFAWWRKNLYARTNKIRELKIADKMHKLAQEKNGIWQRIYYLDWAIGDQQKRLKDE